MENSALNNQFRTVLVGGACVLLAIFLGYIVGTEEYQPLLLGTIIILGCVFWFFSGRFFWILTIASSFLGGTFPILRAQFTPFQILMAMGLIKFLVEDVILRRARLKMPSKFDLLLIAGFMAVITYHGFEDRFGMRFLGSTVWGGRHYVNVFVGLAAFFVIQSIPIKPKLLAKLPYVVLAFVGFDLLVAIVTTIAPSSIYFIYPFYSAVSSSSLQEIIGGDSDVTGRIGAFGNFGFILIAMALARVSLREILHPSKFFHLLCIIAGAIAVLLSGFRSAVLNASILMVTAAVRDLRARALIFIPVIAAGFFALSVINSDVMTLPKQFQRGLAFLPGNWDSDMAQDARASNDFRFSVWTLWWRQYFPERPILGRGFGFKSEWTKQSIRYGTAADYQQMVETGNIHNGALAALDTFGILGTLCFIIWNIRLLVSAFRVPTDRRGGEYIAMRFLALYLAVWIISYWIGAQTVGSFLPQEFALAGLFLRLRQNLKSTETTVPRLAPAARRQFRRELARV